MRYRIILKTEETEKIYLVQYKKYFFFKWKTAEILSSEQRARDYLSDLIEANKQKDQILVKIKT